MLRIKSKSAMLVFFGAFIMLVLDHVLLNGLPWRTHTTARIANPGALFHHLPNTESVHMNLKETQKVQWNAKSLSINSDKAKIVQWDRDRWVNVQKVCNGNYSFEKATLRTSFVRTPIFIHDIKDDMHVSGHLKRYGMWDTKNVNAVVEQLKRDPDLGLLDLGAQLGTHTLVASLLGRNVVAVDPLQSNVLRLCKSLEAGKFTNNVTVVFNAISDDYRKISFVLDKGNLGGTRITSSGTKLNDSKSDSADSLYTVLLDDLLPLVTFKKAVMKLDVETHELQVIKGGTQFFKQIDVTSILMEWMFHKNDEGQQLKVLVMNLGFKPFDPQTHKMCNDNHKTWPDDVMWLKQ
ncbi:uncharacterized protein LOC121382060 [Gigantopelta aegis]|uniref:uncharacterized protein LOC121382060 n=1 Tax=Gigantopelta aegis TaxID=1735272 RepID=UPI001B88D5AC|nr:uncharacterized protein LOC121382060 [Gigantopelta aegis]